MSETPVVPAPVDPTPSAEHRRLSLPQYFLFLLLAAAGIVAMLVLANAAYGIAREYGADPVPWLALAAWALAPAACWTAAMFVLRAGLGQRVWSPWLVGLFVLVLTTLLAGGLTVVAASAHDSARAAGSAACSEADIAALTSVPGYSADLGEPTGQDDGSCSIFLAINAPRSSAADIVVSTMVAAGWTASPAPGLRGIEAARDGGRFNVRAASTDDKGWTDVVVEIPAG